MDFSAVARSARRGEERGRWQSAAETVRNAKASALLETTSGTVAIMARESAAGVVALMRSCLPHQRGNGNARARGMDGWRAFSAGLANIQVQLAERSVPSHVFQTQLLSTLRHEDAGAQHSRVFSTAADASGEKDDESRLWSSGRINASPCRLAVIWRLHESGLLPLCRLLEANETMPAHYFLAGDLFGASCEDATDGLVRDMQALALQAAPSNESDENRQGERRSYVQHGENVDGSPGGGEAATLLADVARYLFDLAYRKLHEGNASGFSWASGGQVGEALSSTAARRVLDRLCCGPDTLGGLGKTRLQACRAVLAAIDPTKAPARRCEPDSHLDLARNTRCMRGEEPAIAVATGERRDKCVTGSSLPMDYAVEVFLARQLRLLVERASGQSGEGSPLGCTLALGGEDSDELGARMVDHGDPSGLLVDVMRHFSSPLFVEVLRSVCLKAVAFAAHATGFLLHKVFLPAAHAFPSALTLAIRQPLLQWETLAPIVGAAAAAYPHDTPHAITLIGTELTETALNLAPPEDSNRDQEIACDRRQGMLILALALRVVAAADMPLQGSRVDKGGFYYRWFRSCFGVTAQEPGEAQPRLAPPGHVQEITESEEQHDGAPELRRMEALRKAMEKERPADILMETLCSSVPCDPAFVLEVHRDVLKTRLRAKFSGRVRDFVDLAVTRLSDLKGQYEGSQRKATGGHPSDSRNGVSGAHHWSGDEGNSTNREVGFFLRQFKQSGEVPPALKTAILWQPKSWAKFRKILLAPPGERIVMPDENGKVVTGIGGVVSEAIGSGQGGLRVEVSLKYRRLLVQQLAKDSLLSAKDYDSFKKAFTEYLQGQRERDAAHSDKPGKEQDATAAVRQLWLLESQLEGRGGVNKLPGNTREAGLSIQDRVAVVLQEYLPRALVLELGIEDGMDGSCHSSTQQHGASSVTAVRESSACSPPPQAQAWFARAAHLLIAVLHEWEQGTSPSLVSSPGDEVLKSRSRTPSPEEIAEAVLNGVHCCVAAVVASLGQNLRSPIALLSPTDQGSSTAPRDSRDPEQERGSGQKENTQPRPRGKYSTSAVPDGRVGQAFRLIGEIVSAVSGVETVAEALARRAFSLLGNPSRLDPRQMLSLAHTVASLTPNFHPRVEFLMEKVVTKALQPNPAATSPENLRCGGDKGELVTTAQFGALYLQSVLILHNHIRTRLAEEACHARSDDAPHATKNNETASGRRSISGGVHAYTPTVLDQETTGFAPIVLLDFLWWMERRLYVAQFTGSKQRRGREARSQAIHVPLLRLLESVVKHPRVEESYRIALGSPTVAMPALERLIAIEVAVSDRDFCDPAAKLAFLKSVTLGRLVNLAPNGFGDLSCGVGGVQGVNARAILGSPNTRSITLGRPGDEAEAAEVKKVWEACISCLFKEPRLRHAAYKRMISQDYWAHAFEDPQSVRARGAGNGADRQRCEEAESRWMHDVHPAWRGGTTSERLIYPEGVGDEELLDSIIHVLGKLCDLEAVSDLIGRRKKAALLLHGTADTREVQETITTRKASAFLRVALSLSKEAKLVHAGTGASIVVLLAEIAIPAIGATEGREAATTAFRCLWQEYFSYLRPLEPAAVASLTRIALMWCEGQSKAEHCASEGKKDCPVVDMLEGLPFLAVEMARVWPGLARFPSMLCVLHDTLGSYAPDSWAIYLSSLHRAGRELVQDLADGNIQLSKVSDDSRIGEAPTSLAARERTDTSNTAKGSTSARGDGRVPLEPLQNGSHDAKKRQHPKPQSAQGCQSEGIEANERRAGKVVCPSRVYEAERSLAEERQATEGASRAAHDRLREAAAAMPQSCAELVVGVVNAAGAMWSKPGRKRPHQVLDSIPVKDKRARSEPHAKRAALGSPTKRGNDETLHVVYSNANSGPDPVEACQRVDNTALQSPAPAAWAARLLEPLYGPVHEEAPWMRSSLEVLLNALIKYLGDGKTRGVGVVSNGAASSVSVGVSNGKCMGLARSWAVSLVVAMLGFAPPLFLRLVEAPCLEATAAAPHPEERMGRSLAVLECLKQVYEEATVFASVQHEVGGGAWLTGILSYYSIAWHSMSDIRDGCKEVESALKPKRHAWEEAVGFVHGQLAHVSPEELRRIPVAIMLQEVDPLLKQYF